MPQELKAVNEELQRSAEEKAELSAQLEAESVGSLSPWMHEPALFPGCAGSALAHVGRHLASPIWRNRVEGKDRGAGCRFREGQYGS